MSAPSETGTASPLAWVLAFYTVVAVGRLGDLIHVLDALPLAKIVAGVAVIVAFNQARTLSKIRLTAIRPAVLTFLILALTTISISYSVLRSGTFAVITGSVLAVAVSFILIVRAAKNWMAVRVMLQGAVAAAIVITLTAVTTQIQGRVGYSSSYDPNDFAFVLVGLLPLVVAFALVSAGMRRLLYLGFLTLTILVILLTQSRGGFLGLIFDALAIVAVFPVVKKGRLQFRKSIWSLVSQIAALLIIGLLCWAAIPGDAKSRLSSIFSITSDYNYNVSEGGRMAIWTRNLPLVIHRPWGYGAGAFETVDGRFAGGRFRAPHNMLLQALIELGIPGFLLLIGVIFSSLRYMTVSLHKDSGAWTRSQLEARVFARAVGVGLLALCVSGFFLSELYSNVLWTLVAFSCAIGIIRRQISVPASSTAVELAVRAPGSNYNRTEFDSPPVTRGLRRNTYRA